MLYYSPFITGHCIVLAAMVGGIMGSFLNCWAWRIVHGESVAKGRSHCDACGHVLGVPDLVPVFSYLLHKGECRYCGVKLSPVHPIAEGISILAFIAVLLKFDITWQLLEFLLFTCLLLVISFADLEGFLVPDRFIVAGLVIRTVFLLTADGGWKEMLRSLLGAAVIPAVLLLVTFIAEKIMGREAMGGGDIKLFFMTGYFLGWQRNLLCLLVSCLVGIVFAFVTKKSREGNEDPAEFPWGPSIALAAFLCLMGGSELISAYLSLFSL